MTPIIVVAGLMVAVAVFGVGPVIHATLTGFGMLLIFVAGRIVGEQRERCRAAAEARTMEALRDVLAHTDPARFQ